MGVLSDLAMSLGLPIKQSTGSITNSPVATITFGTESKAIYIFNRSTTTVLLFSIDGGTTFFGIRPLGSIDRPYIARSLQLKSNSSTSITYDVEYIELP